MMLLTVFVVFVNLGYPPTVSGPDMLVFWLRSLTSFVLIEKELCFCLCIFSLAVQGPMALSSPTTS